MIALVAGAACSNDSPDEAALPFGLVHVEGTEVVGRPAFFEQEPYEFEGEDVRIRSLWAVYRVTAENPGEVFLAWVEQLDGLAIAEMAVRAGSAPSEAWLRAESINPLSPEGVPPDIAFLRLYATEGDPLLVVEIDHADGAVDPGKLRITGDRGRLPAPPTFPGEADRRGGDLLLEENGDELLLPEKTRTETPTLPNTFGDDGAFVVLHAEDGAAAVDELLRKCESFGDDAETTKPETSTVEDVGVITASCVVNGWGFDTVAIRADGDDDSTLYVRSYAL